MNYSQSESILEEIKKAKKFLVNLHRGPDPDSFACAFSLYYFLCDLGKDVEVILTANSRISDELKEFPDFKLVKSVDFSKFNFKDYDLLISPDSGGWQQIVDNLEIKIPDIEIVVIDHHITNEKFGKINLIEAEASSCAEIIYKFFEDLNFEVNKHIANLLLMGIIGDTGGFQFSNNPSTFEIVSKLIHKGADNLDIINKLFRTKKFEQLKVWGEFLVRLNFEKRFNFVWTAIPFEVYERYGFPPKANSHVATMFSNIVEGTKFGIVMIEKEKKVLDVSLRSRNNFDVSKLGEILGGGGHKAAAGGRIIGFPFEEAVEKVLATAKEYVKNI